jgi:MoxR-like ATPase
MATMNPIEHEGTYPLPEAQVDRFLMKVLVTYPTPAEEKEIIVRNTQGAGPKASEVLSAGAILKAQKCVDEIFISEDLKDYIVSLTAATRKPEAAGLKDLKPLIEYGASPRASIAMAAASKARAFLDGRGYASPEDVKALAADVMRHRIILSYEAEAQDVGTEEIIERVLNKVPVP